MKKFSTFYYCFYERRAKAGSQTVKNLWCLYKVYATSHFYLPKDNLLPVAVRDNQ